MKLPEFFSPGCPPGETILVWLCRKPFRATRLVVETEYGFELHGVKIGHAEQLVDGLPGVPCWYLGPKNTNSLIFQTANVGERIELRIRNVTAAMLAFKAHLEGQFREDAGP